MIDTMTIVTVFVAFLILFARIQLSISCYVLMLLFPTSAAVKFGSFGISPGHILIVVLFTRLAILEDRTKSVAETVRFSSSVWVSVYLCIYCVISAIFIPRILSGSVLVNPIGSTEYGPTIFGITVPLGPSSGNFTQTLYLGGSLFVYFIVQLFVDRKERLLLFANAILISLTINLCLSVIDVLGFTTGFGDLLAFAHNGNYTFHVDDGGGGLKRLSASFAEASAFASYTLGGLGFTLRMCLGPNRNKNVFLLTIAQIVAIFVSTSSTGYVGAICIFAMLFSLFTLKSFRGDSDIDFNKIYMFFSAAFIIITLLIYVDNGISEFFVSAYNNVIANKSNTSSAFERGALNDQGLNNFFDTYGLGVGAGSARTSSFAIAVLANMGIPGLVLYTIFFVISFYKNTSSYYDIQVAEISSACLWGGIGIMIAEIISGTSIDLGIEFFIFAALSKPGWQ